MAVAETEAGREAVGKAKEAAGKAQEAEAPRQRSRSPLRTSAAAVRRCGTATDACIYRRRALLNHCGATRVDGAENRQGDGYEDTAGDRQHADV